MLYIWDIIKGKKIWTSDYKAFSVTFSPDGEILAISAGLKGTILVNVTTGKEIKSFGRPKECNSFDNCLVKKGCYQS